MIRYDNVSQGSNTLGSFQEEGTRLGEAPQLNPENDLQEIGAEASEYYTNLEEGALDYQADTPITDVGEVINAYGQAAALEANEILEERQDVVEDLASQGKIPPKVAIDYYNSPLPDENTSLERNYVKNLYRRGGAEDSDVRNYLLTNPEEAAAEQRYKANMNVLKSMIQMIKDDKLAYFTETYNFISGMAPGVDVNRLGKMSLDPNEKYFYSPSGAQDIAIKNYYLNDAAMHEKTEKEYRDYLLDAVEVWRQRGLNNGSIQEALEGLLDPYQNVTAARVGAFGDVADVATVGFATAATGASVAKAGKPLRVVLKESAKTLGEKSLETVPLATTAEKAVSGQIKKPIKALKDFVVDKIDAKRFAGNMKGAGETLAKEVAAGKASVETGEAASKALNTIYRHRMEPTFKVTTETTPQVGRAASVDMSLLTKEGTYNVTDKIAAEIGDMTVPRVVQESTEAGFKKAWGEVVEDSNNLAQISDIQLVTTGSGKARGQIILGNAILGDPAKGFASKEAAGRAVERWMKSGSWSGLDKSAMDIVIYKAENGRYYVQFTGDISANVGKLFSDYFDGKGKVRGNLADKLFGPQGSLPDHWAKLNYLEDRDIRAIENNLRPLQKNIDNLSRTKRRWLEDIKEHSSGFWYDPEWLLNQGVPEDVVLAYQSMRVIEDTLHLMRQRYIINGLKADGYKRLILGLDKEAPVVTGKVVLPQNADFDKYFTKGDGVAFTAKKEDFISGPYKDWHIIEQVEDLGDGMSAATTYLVFPKSELRFGELDIGFFGYIPGGRWYYDPQSYFIKQPVISKMPDGKEVLSDVRTLRGASKLEDAVEYVKNLEAIRTEVAGWLLKNTKQQNATRASLNAFIQQNTGRFFDFNNVDDAVDFFKRERISLDPRAPIGFVKEGDDGLKFTRSLKEALDEPKEAEFKKFLKKDRFSSTSAIRRMERGEGVLDISTDSHVPWVDIGEETRRAIKDMEKFGTMEDYSRLFATEWYNYFKDILPEGVDPVRALRDGVYLPKASPAMVSKANYARDIHNFMRGIPNRLDAAIEQSLANTLESMGESMPWLKSVPYLGNAFTEGTKTFEALTKLKPLNTLRTLTAHYYLGFFNPRQFFTQAAAVNNAILISPVNGWKALPYSFVMPALVNGYDDASIKWACRYLKMNGLDVTPESLKITVDNIRYMNIFGNTPKAGALEAVTKTRSTLSKVSLAPFDWGESIQRGHAGVTALMDAGYLSKPLRELNTKDFSKLMLREGDLYLNMGKTGISTAQMSQLGKTVLQMKGIQLRMLEALLKSNLTAAERIRLFVGHLLLTGVGGVVGDPRLAYNIYDGLTSIGVPDEVALGLQEGLLNNMSRRLGWDIDIAEIFSPQYGQILGDIWEQVTTGPLSYIAGSTATGKTWDTVSTLANVGARVIFGKADINTARAELNLLAARKSLPSSWNRTYLAFQAALEGHKLNTSGKMVASDIDTIGAVMTALGFQTLQEKDIQEFQRRYADYKERINNAYDDVKYVWMDFIRDPTDEATAQFYFAYSANVWSNYGLSYDDISQIYMRLNRDAIRERGEKALDKVLPMMYRMYGTERAFEIYQSRQIGDTND